jgi:hypothetical protein
MQRQPSQREEHSLQLHLRNGVCQLLASHGCSIVRLILVRGCGGAAPVNDAAVLVEVCRRAQQLPGGHLGFVGREARGEVVQAVVDG